MGFRTHDTTHYTTHPGIGCPRVRIGRAAGMIGVEDKTKGDF